MFSNFLFENRAVYEIMYKNIVDRGRLPVATRRMRITCWIPKVTDTHSEYVILNYIPTTTTVARTRLNVTVYVHRLCCAILL